jgi:hypothetical protein
MNVEIRTEAVSGWDFRCRAGFEYSVYVIQLHWVPIVYENYAYPTMVLAKMTLAGRTVERSQVAKDVAPMHHEFEPRRFLPLITLLQLQKTTTTHKQW